LARAAALAPARATDPIAACVKLDLSSSGLTIGATDCDSWYSETVDREPCEPWSGCVDAARLHGFVHSLPPRSLVELVAGDSALTITGEGARGRLTVQRADDFPVCVLRPEEGVTFELDAAALSAALKFVEPSANRDDRRYYQCGAFLDAAGAMAVTTDGNRLAVHRFAAAVPAFDGVILPLPALRLLPSLLKGFADSLTVTVSPRLIRFTDGSWLLTSKLIDGTYPDWRSVLPARSTTPIVVETAALRAAVDRISEVCFARTSQPRAARLRLADGELCVSATADTAEAEVETVIAVEAGPTDVEVALSTRYLGDALGVLEAAEQVELHIPRDHGPVWVCAEGETENGIAIMRMRV
jgi:DNA polymerase-3 subunit beta